MAPYLTSDYELLGGAQRNTAGVVFGRSPQVVFREWLSSWARQLVQQHCKGGWPCQLLASAVPATLQRAALTVINSAGVMRQQQCIGRPHHRHKLPMGPADCVSRTFT